MSFEKVLDELIRMTTPKLSLGQEMEKIAFVWRVCPNRSIWEHNGILP